MRGGAWHGELRCPVAIIVHGSWPVVVVVGRDVADVDVDDCGYADANVVPCSSPAQSAPSCAADVAL